MSLDKQLDINQEVVEPIKQVDKLVNCVSLQDKQYVQDKLVFKDQLRILPKTQSSTCEQCEQAADYVCAKTITKITLCRTGEQKMMNIG